VNEGSATMQQIVDDPVFVENLKKSGYDAVRLTEPEGRGITLAVVNKDIIKTKAQLTDIWEKANPKSIRFHKKDPQGIIKKQLDDIYTKAPGAKDQIDKIADDVVAKFGSDFKIAKTDLKKYETAYKKIFNKYNGDIDKLGDVARNTIIVNNADDLPKYMKALESKNGVGYFTDPNKDPLGYSGVNMKMKANGIKAEIQVNTPEMIYAKEEAKLAKGLLGSDVYNSLNKKFKGKGGKGHIFYAEWRDPKTSLKRKAELEKISRSYYKSFR